MLCRILPWLFAAFYLAALMLLVVGTFGLFGSERGPLAGVFIVPLGIPWIWLIDLAPEKVWPWLAAAAPSLNLCILWIICRRLRQFSA